LDLSVASYIMVFFGLLMVAACFCPARINDGFALITAQDTVVVDAKSDRRIIGDNDYTEKQARAFMQRVMETIEGL